MLCLRSYTCRETTHTHTGLDYRTGAGGQQHHLSSLCTFGGGYDGTRAYAHAGKTHAFTFVSYTAAFLQVAGRKERHAAAVCHFRTAAVPYAHLYTRCAHTALRLSAPAARGLHAHFSLTYHFHHWRVTTTPQLIAVVRFAASVCYGCCYTCYANMCRTTCIRHACYSHTPSCHTPASHTTLLAHWLLAT